MTTSIVNAATRFEHELELALVRALMISGDRIVSHAKRTTLFTDHTGLLRRSIARGTIEQGPDGPRLEVRAGGLSVGYAPAVHDGSRPHVIRPQKRQSLRFVGGDGNFIFRRAVRHPGTEPRPFLSEAAEATLPAAERDLAQAVELALHRAGFLRGAA